LARFAQPVSALGLLAVSPVVNFTEGESVDDIFQRRMVSCLSDVLQLNVMQNTGRLPQYCADSRFEYNVNCSKSDSKKTMRPLKIRRTVLRFSKFTTGETARTKAEPAGNRASL